MSLGASPGWARRPACESVPPRCDAPQVAPGSLRSSCATQVRSASAKRPSWQPAARAEGDALPLADTRTALVRFAFSQESRCRGPSGRRSQAHDAPDAGPAVRGSHELRETAAGEVVGAMEVAGVAGAAVRASHQLRERETSWARWRWWASSGLGVTAGLRKCTAGRCAAALPVALEEAGRREPLPDSFCPARPSSASTRRSTRSTGGNAETVGHRQENLEISSLVISGTWRGRCLAGHEAVRHGAKLWL